MTVELKVAEGWLTVCELSALVPGRGWRSCCPTAGRPRCSSTARGAPTRSATRTPSPGRRSSRAGCWAVRRVEPFVASPLLKQRFDLESGRCLDDEEVAVRTYPVRTAATS